MCRRSMSERVETLSSAQSQGPNSLWSEPDNLQAQLLRLTQTVQREQSPLTLASEATFQRPAFKKLHVLSQSLSSQPGAACAHFQSTADRIWGPL